MNQTEQYQLNQWDKSDRIMMEDFNADNAKIEAALAEHEEILSAVPKLGNCQLYYETYVGNGGLSMSRTFPHKPMIIFINEADGSHSHRFIRGCTASVCSCGNTQFYPELTWSGNTVSWFSGRATESLNYSGYTYYLVALMDMSAE